jgi:hypothetical protein
MNISSCSPKVLKSGKYKRENFTCYSIKELKKIAKDYNKIVKKNNKIKDISRKKKRDLWEELIEKNKNNCGYNEKCWLKQNYVLINNNKKERNRMLSLFRPDIKDKEIVYGERPLRTLDIWRVMEQYEENNNFRKENDFKFVGVFPLDFEEKYGNKCISEEICNLDIRKEVKRGKTKFGMCFNLDYHNLPGSHWVCLYINANKRDKNYGIYYYDSEAEEMPIEIRNYIKRLIRENKYILKDIKVITNNKGIKHQKSGNECGVYVIYFLERSINGVNYNKLMIDKRLRNNRSMNLLRRKYFSFI